MFNALFGLLLTMDSAYRYRPPLPVTPNTNQIAFRATLRKLLLCFNCLPAKKNMPKTVINSHVSTLIDSVCQMGVDRQAMEVLARQLTGSNDFPQRIEFQHSLTADLQEYQHILGCQVLFKRKHNVLVLSQAQLCTPIRLADPSQLEHHAELLQRRLKSLKQKASLAERVVTLISSLPAVEWAPDHIAALLKMPLRTLQRSLQKEGASYQYLLDQFRKQQSKKLLLTTDLSIAQIGEKLGYLNLSSFHRAFQRWFGTTPAVFRKQVPPVT